MDSQRKTDKNNKMNQLSEHSLYYFQIVLRLSTIKQEIRKINKNRAEAASKTFEMRGMNKKL